MKTTILMTIEHSKPIPDLTDIAAGRVYTLDGVKDVTATIQEPVPVVSSFDEMIKEVEASPDWEEAQAWAAEHLASLRSAKKPGFWSRVWGRA